MTGTKTAPIKFPATQAQWQAQVKATIAEALRPPAFTFGKAAA